MSKSKKEKQVALSLLLPQAAMDSLKNHVLPLLRAQDKSLAGLDDKDLIERYAHQAVLNQIANDVAAIIRRG